MPRSRRVDASPYSGPLGSSKDGPSTANNTDKTRTACAKGAISTKDRTGKKPRQSYPPVAGGLDVGVWRRGDRGTGQFGRS